MTEQEVIQSRGYQVDVIRTGRSKTARVQVEDGSVGVKTFKSRWGSCTVKDEILFNWKVIQAPQRVVDYVVTHELCHLKHHDHSAAFWHSVERVMPDYLACKDWLKHLGPQLEL